MQKFKKLFPKSTSVIGMIHLQALPGTPKYGGSRQAIIDHALKEAEIYKKAGIDGLAIENMHDVPYLKNQVGPEITSLMAIIGYEIKRLTPMPCGIQVLSSANEAALAIAMNAGLDFIRAEGFVFGHVADEGYVDACAGDLLRYRKNIGAETVAVFTDIKKKHSAHTITGDIDIVETAKAAAYFLSDGLIITGGATGQRASLSDLTAVKKTVAVPVMIGSGITLQNIAQYSLFADALIVGSYFKKDGHWANELMYEKVARLMDEKEAAIN